MKKYNKFTIGALASLVLAMLLITGSKNTINTEAAAVDKENTEDMTPEYPTSGGAGTKSSPYVIRFDDDADEWAALGLDFRGTVQGALNMSLKHPGKYYRVVLPSGGTYKLDKRLRIFSNTTLDAAGSTILSSGTNMVVLGYAHSDEHPVTDGYDTYKDVSVIGGIWDGYGSTRRAAGGAKTSAIMRFAHCTNLTVMNLTLRNVYDAHHMEVAACKNVQVKNVNFKDTYVSASEMALEAFQIDICNKNFTLFYNGSGEKYGCSGVEVTGCRFENVKSGVGSHSSDSSHPYTNIKIHNNTFKNLGKHSYPKGVPSMAVAAYLWKSGAVYENTMTNVYTGIDVRFECKELAVRYNRIKNAYGCGIHVIGGICKSIHHNTLSGCHITGIYLHNCGTNRTLGAMYSNTISSQSGTGILILGSRCARVYKNTVNSATSDGIRVTDWSKVTKIDHNTVKNIKSYGIHSGRISEIGVLSSNTIKSAKKRCIHTSNYGMVRNTSYNSISGCGASNKASFAKGGQGVAFSKTNVKVKKKKKYKVKKILSVTAGAGDVVYLTGNAKVCTVDSKGVIKANKKGKTTVSAVQGKSVTSVTIVVK